MNLQIIEVVIGIIFVYLLLSLLITSIQELISGFLKLRSKQLAKAVKRMLSDDEEDVNNLLGKFYDHYLIKYLSKDKNHRPSYLSSKDFAKAITDILKNAPDAEDIKKSITDGINSLKDGDTKKLLLSFWNESEQKIEKFTKSIENWYDATMERVTGWYKRLIQKYILFVGLAIAIIFNADSLMIYKILSTDQVKRTMLADMATNYVQLYQEVKDTTDKTDLIKKYKNVDAQLDSLSNATSILGLGWSKSETNRMFCPTGFITGVRDWVLKLLGWIVTALAVSLGAPFWFDLLSKIINIRNSGKVPKIGEQNPGS